MAFEIGSISVLGEVINRLGPVAIFNYEHDGETKCRAICTECEPDVVLCSVFVRNLTIKTDADTVYAVARFHAERKHKLEAETYVKSASKT